MRQVELDPTLIGAMPPEGHARQWRTLLFSANLMLELPPPSAEDSPPVQTIRAIQESFATLPGLQDDVTAVSHPLGWTTGEVPNQVWGGIAAFFIVLLWLTNNVLVAMCGAPVLLAPVAVVGLLVAGVLELNRRKQLEAKTHDLLENRGELAGLVMALLQRDFVCRVGAETVIYNQPSVLWLKHRRDENRQLELGPWFKEAHDAARAKVRAVVEAAPDFEPVEIDLGPSRQRLEEAGRDIRTMPAVDEALRAVELGST